MAYLIYADFKKSIQLANLAQVIGSDVTIINSWMLAAQEKVTSYLTQKYQTELEFTDTRTWDPALSYQAADRVYLDAPEYDTHTAYVPGQYVVNANNLYRCLAGTVGIFAPAKWMLVGPRYTLYYVAYPQPRFNIGTAYNKGDRVYYQGKVYTALQASATYGDSYLLQVGKLQNIPPVNNFPGARGYNQWDGGEPYAVPAVTLITDTAFWTPGDNRSQQMLQIMADLVLFYAHQRISPMSIPELRKENYREAINWLIDAGEGNITPNLPLRQPFAGNKIRYGGSVRSQYNY